MREPETVNQAIQALASDPKVATLVATGTTTLGAAVHYDVLTGIFSLVSMFVGIITALVVLGIQSIKLVRVWKAWKADQPEPADLK
jgi:hypothetical protein